MKKLIVIVLALTLVITGCASNQAPEITAEPTEEAQPIVTEEPVPAEPIEVSVMVPFGSPALSMSGLLLNEDDQKGMYDLGENASYDIEIVNGADPLVAAFTSQSHDVIVAPTNLGAKFYNTGIPYVYTGAVVYGNLYIASLEPLDSISDLEGIEVVAFAQNATPDVVLQTVIKANDLADKVTIRYVGSVNEAQGELLAGKAQAALLAEPILSVTKTKAEVNILDLQNEWSTITGAQSYPQAGVYVKAELADTNPELVSLLLEIIQTSVRDANENPAQVAAALQAIEFGLPSKIIESAIPNSHLVFEYALDSKDELEFYYNKIMELNPALIGGTLPDDAFYR